MIKVNNECVSHCILCCLKETESKFGEALSLSDGLVQYASNAENLRNEVDMSFLFCQTVQFCDAVTCLVVTDLDLPPLPPKSKNMRIRVFIRSKKKKKKKKSEKKVTKP